MFFLTLIRNMESNVTHFRNLLVWCSAVRTDAKKFLQERDIDVYYDVWHIHKWLFWTHDGCCLGFGIFRETSTCGQEEEGVQSLTLWFMDNCFIQFLKTTAKIRRYYAVFCRLCTFYVMRDNIFVFCVGTLWARHCTSQECCNHSKNSGTVN